MALNTYAALKLDGIALAGDVTITSIAGVDVSSDHIELFELEFGTQLPVERGTTLATSHRQILPVRLKKRLDKTTPRFYQALANNQRVEGDIKVFEPDPTGTGGMRHRFTVRLTEARITSIKSHVPDSANEDESSAPPFEVIEIIPHTIAYVDEIESVEYEDRWSEDV